MANRCAAPILQAGLNPPWLLSSFDNNWLNPANALNDASLGYVNGISTDAGSANNYVVTCVIGVPSAYNQGMVVAFVPANTNTGPSNLSVNGITAASIVLPNGSATPAGAIVAGTLVAVVYIGTSFRIIGGGNYNVVQSFQPQLSPGTISPNCAGASAFQFQADVSTAGTYTIDLLNVSIGTVIDMALFNPGGNTGRLLVIQASDPSSTAYDCRAIYQGGQAHFSAGAHDTFTNAILYHGVAMSDVNSADEILWFQASYF
jgi:hypothetical protein